MTDYTKLVKALRCKRDDCAGCDLAFLDNDEGWMCRYAAKDDDAADAIEALQAQLPKRGEWIHIEGDDPWEWTCSACMKKSEVHGEEPAFCPNCGAKMEVQDGE